MNEKAKGYKARNGMRRSSTQTVNELGDEPMEDGDE
jgi:hypothetical protein